MSDFITSPDCTDAIMRALCIAYTVFNINQFIYGYNIYIYIYKYIDFVKALPNCQQLYK